MEFIVTAGSIWREGELDTRVNKSFEPDQFVQAYELYMECADYAWRRIEFIKDEESTIILED